MFSGIAFVLAMCGMVLVPDTILRSLALGAILVGIVSVVAAMTLLPALMSMLGDRVNALEIPVIGRCAIRRQARRGRSGRHRARGDEATTLEPAWRLRRFCSRLRFPFSRSRPASRGSARCLTACPPSRASRARTATSRSRRGSGTDRRRGRCLFSPGSLGDRASSSQASDAGVVQPAELGRTRRAVTSWCSRFRSPGTRMDPKRPPRSGNCAPTSFPRHSVISETTVLVGGETAEKRRLLRHRRQLASDRVHVRARPQLPPTHGRLPLGCHPRRGDRPQPALGRSRLRVARARLPEGRRERAVRLPTGRHDRGLGAALPLLGALRPLDGLPGLPAQPDQGALHADRRHRRMRSPTASARPRV